jgi:hypothetical protein
MSGFASTLLFLALAVIVHAHHRSVHLMWNVQNAVHGLLVLEIQKAKAAAAARGRVHHHDAIHLPEL